MYLRIYAASDENVDTIETFLAPFLNRSRVEVDKVIYDEQERMVEIPLVRQLFRSRITVFGKQLRYTGEERPAILRIGNVNDLHIQSKPFLFTTLGGVFTILFGLKVNKQTLYLSSVEEEKGEQACEFVIGVTSIDLELVDM